MLNINYEDLLYTLKIRVRGVDLQWNIILIQTIGI